jgi:hypothetical protein
VPLQFDVAVSDGQLNVEFDTAFTYACAVQAIVVFPVAKLAMGEAFLEELFARQKVKFDYEYVQASFLPTGTATSSPTQAETTASGANDATTTAASTSSSGGGSAGQRPFDLFHREPHLFVRAFDRANQATDLDLWSSNMHHTMVVGQTSPITFTIRVKASADAPASDGGLRSRSRLRSRGRWRRRQADPLAALVVTGFDFNIPGVAIAPHTVRSKIVRLSEGVYTAQPLLLDPLTTSTMPLTIAAGTSRRFWLHATASAPGRSQQHPTATLWCCPYPPIFTVRHNPKCDPFRCHTSLQHPTCIPRTSHRHPPKFHQHPTALR